MNHGVWGTGVVMMAEVMRTVASKDCTCACHMGNRDEVSSLTDRVITECLAPQGSFSPMQTDGNARSGRCLLLVNDGSVQHF